MADAAWVTAMPALEHGRRQHGLDGARRVGDQAQPIRRRQYLTGERGGPPAGDHRVEAGDASRQFLPGQVTFTIVEDDVSKVVQCPIGLGRKQDLVQAWA